MTSLSLAFVLLVAIPDPSPFWPVTSAGWITLIGGTISLLGILGAGLWAYAKFLAHLNGLGDRVDKLTSRADAAEAREKDLATAVDRITSSTEQLLREVGRAQRQADDCDGNTERFAIDIGSKLNDFQRTLGERIGSLGERMAGVERELELGRQVRFNIPHNSPRGS